MRSPIFIAVVALASISSLFSASFARAYESEDFYGYQTAEDAAKDVVYAAPQSEGRMQKFNAALTRLGVPLESAPDYSDFPADGESSMSDILPHLHWIDYQGGLARYLNINSGSAVSQSTFSLYPDFVNDLVDGKTLSHPTGNLEFRLHTKPDGDSDDSGDLLETLQTVSRQVQGAEKLPLSGFKILIDPGHMGTPEWDIKTGKYVQPDSKGNHPFDVRKKDGYVSEGQINLWTALLVAKELERQGATVKLTRDQDGAIFPYQNMKEDEVIKTYDATEATHQVLYNTLDDWMAKWMGGTEASVAENLRKDSRVKGLFENTFDARQALFISNYDLEARSKIIDAFKPDLTLDIHYDAEDSGRTQSNVDEVEAYVPGAFFTGETGSRLNRALALKHLVEPNRWNESVNLASEITQSMSKALKLPLMTSPVLGGAVKVKDGVYARNLYISRRVRSGLMVYLECLHYDYSVPENDPRFNEFKAMSHQDRTGNYQGREFSYPARIDQVAAGITHGISNYFNNLTDN